MDVWRKVGLAHTNPNPRFAVSLKPLFFSCIIFKIIYTKRMRILMAMGIGFVFASCSTVSHGPYKQNAMAEDSVDWSSKYNLMDSSDGSDDPNIKWKVWGAKY